MNPIWPLEQMVVALLLLLLASGLLAWQSAGKARPWLRALLTALRAAAILLLGLLALNPGRWVHEDRNIANEWAVLMDRSHSMSVPDVDGKQRWNKAVQIARTLNEATPPGASSKPRFFSFSDRLEEERDKDKLFALPCDGLATDIPGAGETLLSRLATGPRRWKAIILISDGRQTRQADSASFAIRARARETPVYALPLGGDVPRHDISLAPLQRQHVAFINQPLRMAATIRNENLGNVKALVQLRDNADKIMQECTLALTNNETALAAFEVSFPDKGYRECRFTVSTPGSDDNPDNNSARAGIVVLSERIRVLTVEGNPHWDSKFLIQLLRTQPHMEVTSLYRLSADRFFRVETDSSVSDSSAAIFPDTLEELRRYDVVLFGKSIDYFLTADRISLLQQFVRDQGGSIIYARGKPYSTALDELGPLESVTWGEPLNAEIRWQPTRAGNALGFFGTVLPSYDDPVWKQLPAMSYAHRCPSLPAFAQALIEGQAGAGGNQLTLPLLVSRRIGRGLVVTVNAEGLWQWDFFRSSTETSRLYRELWTQLVQWSAMHSEFLPGCGVALRLNASSVFPDTPARAQVEFRSPPAQDPDLRIQILRSGTQVQELRPTKAGSPGGAWSAAFTLAEPGSYQVKLLTQESGKAVELNAALIVRPTPAEKDNESADPAFLKELADGSGGRMVTEAELPALAAALSAPEPVSDTARAVWEPAWDRAWLLILLLAVPTLEWFLRRRNGLL